ncbi:hypothetical protein SCA6_004049 [Theobroma cacao]
MAILMDILTRFRQNRRLDRLTCDPVLDSSWFFNWTDYAFDSQQLKCIRRVYKKLDHMMGIAIIGLSTHY